MERLTKTVIVIVISVLAFGCGETLEDPENESDFNVEQENDTGPQCGDHEEVCDDTCTDIRVNDDHCGECGNACDSNKTCDGFGECVCEDGYFDCAGECKSIDSSYDECGGECINTDADHDHCGACEQTCLDDVEVCSEGLCESDCAAGQDICGGACFDLQTDGDNCGDCGNDCPDVETSDWGTCEPVDASDVCSDDGVQFRTVTNYSCDGGLCEPEIEEESQGCTLNTDELNCGDTTEGPWSNCEPVDDNTCTTEGERSRDVFSYSCSGNTCEENTTTETVSCSIPTDGLDCSEPSYGDWSACGNFGSECSQSGERDRIITHYECSSGTCEIGFTETETEPCTRDTENNSCGAEIEYGDWSECDFETECAETGEQERTVTHNECSSGQCGSYTETETQSCSRSTAGDSCGEGVTFGDWSDCDFGGDTCTESGTRSRTKYTHTCDDSQCSYSTSTDSETCTRNTEGDSCDGGDGTCDGGQCLGCLSDSDCDEYAVCSMGNQCEFPDYNCDDYGNPGDGSWNGQVFEWGGNEEPGCFGNETPGEPDDEWHCDPDTGECCPYDTSSILYATPDKSGAESLEHYCRVRGLLVRPHGDDHLNLFDIESTIEIVDSGVTIHIRFNGHYLIGDTNLSTFKNIRESGVRETLEYGYGLTINGEKGGQEQVTSLTGFESLETVEGGLSAISIRRFEGSSFTFYDTDEDIHPFPNLQNVESAEDIVHTNQISFDSCEIYEWCDDTGHCVPDNYDDDC